MEGLLFFAVPLFWTVVFETAGAYVLGMRKKDLLLVVLVNVITNLTMNLLLTVWQTADNLLLVYGIFEPLVVLAEYLFYRSYLKQKRIHPLLLSLLLNLLSITGGLFV